MRTLTHTYSNIHTTLLCRSALSILFSLFDYNIMRRDACLVGESVQFLAAGDCIGRNPGLFAVHGCRSAGSGLLGGAVITQEPVMWSLALRGVRDLLAVWIVERVVSWYRRRPTVCVIIRPIPKLHTKFYCHVRTLLLNIILSKLTPSRVSWYLSRLVNIFFTASPKRPRGLLATIWFSFSHLLTSLLTHLTHTFYFISLLPIHTFPLFCELYPFSWRVI